MQAISILDTWRLHPMQGPTEETGFPVGGHDDSHRRLPPYAIVTIWRMCAYGKRRAREM